MSFRGSLLHCLGLRMANASDWYWVSRVASPIPSPRNDLSLTITVEQDHLPLGCHQILGLKMKSLGSFIHSSDIYKVSTMGRILVEML